MSFTRALLILVSSFAVVTAMACNGGSSSGGVFSSEGSGGPISGGGEATGCGFSGNDTVVNPCGGPGASIDASTGSPVVPASPFIACTLPDTNMGDAGLATDADGGDGGHDSGTSPPPPPSPPSSSPCDSPPPDQCNGQLNMVHWDPGYCDGQQCQFSAESFACPGGCFTQLDGGPRCNNND